MCLWDMKYREKERLYPFRFFPVCLIIIRNYLLSPNLILFAVINMDSYINPRDNTILLSLYTVIISFFICFPVAYYIAKIARKENKLTLVLLVIAPNMVSGFIIILSWLLFLADYGVLYFILKYLKLIEGPLHILYTRVAVTIGLVYSSTLWMFIPLYAVLESLDNSLIEAAADLGASNSRILLRIIIPYSKTAIGTGCTLTFLQALGSYIIPRFLGGKSGLMYVQLEQGGGPGHIYGSYDGGGGVYRHKNQRD